MTFGLRVTHTISMGAVALIAGLSAFYLWRTAPPTRERQYTIGFTLLFLVAWGIRVDAIDSFLMKLTNNQFCSKWIAYECSLFAVYLILLSMSVSEAEKRKAGRFFKYVIAVAVFIPLMMPSVPMVENPWAIRTNFWRFFITDLVVFSFYSWVLLNVMSLTVSRLRE